MVSFSKYFFLCREIIIYLIFYLPELSLIFLYVSQFLFKILNATSFIINLRDYN
ncbi:hypothetical protein O3G_MSEX000221 [Manduca sexta]|nr:hypothetical protein O3G_MSEX000221 [Manduca sexta]